MLAIAASIAAWRLPQLVQTNVARELAGMGLPDARFTIADVGWGRATLTDLTLAPDVSAEAIEIDYRDPLSILSGRIDAVRIRGARWTTSLEGMEGSTPARLLARPAGEGTPPGRIEVLDAHVFLPDVTLLVDGELVPASGGFWVSAHTSDGRATIEVSGDPREALWRVEGTLAPALAAHLPATSLDGELHASGRGAAHHAGHWVVDGSVELAFDGMRLPSIDAQARGVHAWLVGEATLGDGLALRVDAHTRIAVDRAYVPGTRVEGVEVEGALHVEREGSSVRAFADGPLEVQARVLAVGATRATELQFRHVRLAGASVHGQPVLELASHDVHVAIRFQGGSSVGGVLRASSARLGGTLEIASAGSGVRASIATRLEAPSVRVRDGETTLTDAFVELPLAWNEHGVFSAAGHARAGALRWRDVELGAVEGSLDLSQDRVAIDWTGRATETASFELRASIARTTTLDVDVPSSEVTPSDAFHRALVATAGIDVRGRAGGVLHVEPGSPGLGTATLTFDGASIDDVTGRGGARGAHGSIALASLDPIASAAADRVAFSELRLGRLLTTRDGSARLRFERTGEVTVEQAQASIAGGHLYADTFRFAPSAPDLSLALRFDGIEMDRIAALLAHDTVRVSGVLDGHLALHVHLGDVPTIQLGEGVLVARGPGRLRITSLPALASAAAGVSLDLDQLASGAWIEARLLSALSDFEYSDLTFDIDRIAGQPCLHASITGHGALAPQELDLTIAVEDVQLLVDQSLRLWTAGQPRARPEAT